MDRHGGAQRRPEGAAPSAPVGASILFRCSLPPLFAWLSFCCTRFPVVGFTDVGVRQHIVVADHYQHLALIGVVAVAAAGVALVGTGDIDGAVAQFQKQAAETGQPVTIPGPQP